MHGAPALPAEPIGWLEVSDIQARFRIDWPGFCLDVDLRLPGGGVTALFGPSGSGKTSLLRCIAGLQRASGGLLTVNGELWQDATHWLPTHRRPLGYVFQEASLFPHLNVQANLRYGLKRSTHAREVDLEQAIELLGIEPLLARKPERLSGGERQRVAIARALAVSPQVLLMDEPLAALDLARKREVLPYLERLRDKLGIPMIYVSHAADEVARLADFLVAMNHGKVVAAGPLGETLARLDLPIHLGEDLGVVIEATVGAIDQHYHLARVDFHGGHLWARDQGIATGARVRLRVLARDVSLACEQPQLSSIQNILAGRIEVISDDMHPGLTLVRVRVGGQPLVARLTRRALVELKLAVGQNIWLQVKSVALLD